MDFGFIILMLVLYGFLTSSGSKKSDDTKDTADEVEETKDEKVENTIEKSQDKPTVTRVSNNDLRNKLVDRPTVWRRKR